MREKLVDAAGNVEGYANVLGVDPLRRDWRVEGAPGNDGVR